MIDFGVYLYVLHDDIIFLKLMTRTVLSIKYYFFLVFLSIK